MNLDDAAALAARLHAGQVDKQGRDYFRFHLVPVAYALGPFGPLAMIAGLLHDAIEDTDADAESLRAAGVPYVAVSAVVSVTRVPGESYTDLIARSAVHPLGCLVKLADNALNLESNAGLAVTDPEKARSLREDRYLPARARLLDAAAGHEVDLAGWGINRMTSAVQVALQPCFRPPFAVPVGA